MLVELPEHGIVSFNRAGEGLDLVLEADFEIRNLVDDREGNLYFQRRKSSGPMTLAEIRGVTSFVDVPLGFSESQFGEFLFRQWGRGLWTKDGETLSTVATDGKLTRAAIFPSFEMMRDSGLGFSWIVYRSTESGQRFIAVLETNQNSISGEDMDLQRQANLIELLESPSHVIRREARFEVLAEEVSARAAHESSGEFVESAFCKLQPWLRWKKRPVVFFSSANRTVPKF